MSTQSKSVFERRFDHVVGRSRVMQILTILGWTGVALCASLVLMASADYFLEIPWRIRAWFLALLGTACLVVAVRQLVNVFLQTNRRSTAAALEQRFDDLGQSVRTAVEFGPAVDESDRFSASLVRALGENVRQRTDELRLTEAIPTFSLKVAGGLLAVVVALIAVACCASWECRTAASRVLAFTSPYTTVQVDPGDVRVKQDTSIRLVTSISGRTNRETTLLTRELDKSDAPWQARPLGFNERLREHERGISYAVRISKVASPFEYRVIAGGYFSPLHTVDVQYPLTIESFETKVQSPEYTQLEDRLVTTGNFHGVDGSIAHLNVKLSQAPDSAWLELRPLVTRLGEDAETETIPLAIRGRMLSAVLRLDRDLAYQVFATSADGLQLRRNRFRIRVHDDRPPRVAFQTLKPTVRVHALSELELKLSVADDYGLKRAGIVFQFNNEPELVLESVDFQDIVRADGSLAPRTKEIVVSMLELEYLEMTEKDSISYYGFAEDKRPGEPNVNETDLRFIDVLPFRRLFIQASTGNRGLRGLGQRRRNNNAQRIPALGTLISKERFVLNRSLQMERSDRRGQKINVAALDSVVNVQNKNSENTGRLADRATQLEMRFGIPEEGRISDLLYQARDSMLLAADSLNSVELNVATLQQRDALGYLHEAREKIESLLRGRNSSNFRRVIAGLTGGMRNNQARRRSQTKRNEARVTEIIMRLNDAAARQEQVLDDYVKVVRTQRADGDSDDPAATDQSQLTAARRRIQSVQARLLADLRGVAESVEKLENLSELSKQRSLEAARTAEGIDEAVAEGDWEFALEMAIQAGPSYRLLATNIEAVSAADTSRRIGTARDLGIQLTEALRDQARRANVSEMGMDQGEQPSYQPPENPAAGTRAHAAELNAEIGRTVGDILNSVIDPELGIADPEDVVVRRLSHLIRADKLDETIERLQPIAEMIQGEDWAEVVVQAEDIADRLDIVTQRLDALQREIMSPRIERLRQLAKRTAEARQELAQLATEDQIDRWFQSVDGLLNDIEESDTAIEQVKRLREVAAGDAETEASGEVNDDNGTWPLNASKTAFVPPAGYHDGLSEIIEEIERHIRELLVSDKRATVAGAVPPKYKNLVGLFLESLAEKSNEQKAMAPTE